jgi:hydroxymethylglutaryl-CoA lyase
MSAANDTLLVQEIAPRDGLQIEPVWIETDRKIALIDGLSECGFTRIEAGSFVSPKAIPMLRDGGEVFARIRRRPGCLYVALVPNMKGAERAIAAGVDELNLVVSASETHNGVNMRMSTDSSFEAFARIAEVAASTGVRLNGTVATAFGCPFESGITENRVISFAERYLALGITNVTLADTTGMADPRLVTERTGRVLRLVPAAGLTLHFHNTRGLGLANVLAGFQAGARRFDASLGGLGGCPFAPGATGNICTEDLVHMCHAMGIPTGIDLDRLLALSRSLPALLGHDEPGQVAKAGPVWELHPAPASAKAASGACGTV